MSYRIRRVDENQPEIVAAFRKLGAKVFVLSEIGRGFPDLLIGFPGHEMKLVEIKDGKKPPSQRKLTEAETKFTLEWGEWCELVESVEDVVKVAQRARNGG